MGDMADDYEHQQLSESLPYNDGWNPRGYKQTTPESEIGSRANDVPAKASPLDFHKQVEAIFKKHWLDYIDAKHKVQGNNGDRLRYADDKAIEAFTALIQTLVPEEDTRAFPGLNGPLPDSPVRETCYKQGWNECRDIILSTIKGKV